MSLSNAVKPGRKGVFTAKAAAAGRSVSEYAAEEQGASGALGKEARLALVYEKLGRKRKRSK